MTELPVAMNRERERAVERLRAHYVRDDIDVDVYERMVDAAWAAKAPDDIERIFANLPALPEADRPIATTGASSDYRPARASAAEQKAHGFQIAIMGGSDRKGSWVPPKRLSSLAVMGGAGLDFREARLGPGVTEVTIVAIMGGAEVIVPPGVTVQTDGIGIMGGFDGFDQTVDSHGDPMAPVLRIRGLALMGGVEVKMMLPGETSREAKRRRRDERKLRKEERRRRQLQRGED